jgi:LL-diaminopimelate aminotransferase
MKAAVEKPAHHRYPSYEGMPSFRESAAAWVKRRFGVTLDAKTEILSLIGSKEGIGHIPLAFVNPGDAVLCPSPGYPVYAVGTLFAGGIPHLMPLTNDNGYFPDFSAIPEDVLKKAKIMFLNYPNNPTSADCTLDAFKEAIALAQKYDIIICHDAAYSELYFDGLRPMSFLEVPGAMDVGIEFHSMSKTYNMTGWRIGFAAGNAKILAGLGKIKTNVDSGVFQAVQEASIAAMETDIKTPATLTAIRDTFQARRDALYEGLTSVGLSATRPRATFYLWTKVPSGYTSERFSIHLLDKAGVMGTPGNGFGDPGEGYIRFALTAPVERIKEAAERIRKVV